MEETNTYEEELEFEYTSEWLQENTKIRGWLVLFLISAVVGSFRSIIDTMTYVIWTDEIFMFIPVFIIIIVALICVYAFNERKSYAVFYAKSMLTLNVISNAFFLIFNQRAINVGSTVISLCVSLIWFLYLNNSEVVEEVIPSEFRNVSNKHYAVAIAGFTIMIIGLMLI